MPARKTKDSAANRTAVIISFILLVCIIAFIWYVGIRSGVQTDNAKQQNAAELTAPDINSASDLDKASSTLDQINLDQGSADAKQLDDASSDF